MTDAQRNLARHALGLPNRSRCSYRNHYVIDQGPDYEAWMAMVADNLARRHAMAWICGGVMFTLTRAGAELALKPRRSAGPRGLPLSLRWRTDGRLLCAAKHPPLTNDIYFDDAAHYRLSEAGLIVPQPDEHTTGRWRWATWMDRLRGCYWYWWWPYERKLSD